MAAGYFTLIVLFSVAVVDAQDSKWYIYVDQYLAYDTSESLAFKCVGLYWPEFHGR